MIRNASLVTASLALSLVSAGCVVDATGSSEEDLGTSFTYHCHPTHRSGASEAVSLGTPLITSNWPVLRGYFSQGTVHVPNTLEGVCEGVRRAQREQAKLQQEILLLRQQLEAEWVCKYAELMQLLQQS